MWIQRWLEWLKWPGTLAVLAGLLATAYLVHDAINSDREREGETVSAPRRAKGGVVTLSPEQIEVHAIEEEEAKEVEWSEPLKVYGRLVPNPNATAVVQASFAGTFQANSQLPWPAVGTRVRANQVLGQVAIRVGPQERLDLQLKLNEAEIKVLGAGKVLAIQKERLDRLSKASRSGEIVTQRELDDARVQLTETTTALSTDQAAVELWKHALEAVDKRGEGGMSAYSYPLIAPADGEVVETAARPGAAVEAGVILARIVDFRRPLAQLDLPAEVLEAGPPATVDLTALSPTPAHAAAAPMRLTATLLGPAPQVEPTTQQSSYWYHAALGADDTPSANVVWRPGRFVHALIRVPAAVKRSAVSVPMGAILVHQGRLLVYVREGPGRFERREVRLLGREGGRAILGSGVNAGEPVVTAHAQVLLSEEFRTEGEDD